VNFYSRRSDSTHQSRCFLRVLIMEAFNFVHSFSLMYNLLTLLHGKLSAFLVSEYSKLDAALFTWTFLKISSVRILFLICWVGGHSCSYLFYAYQKCSSAVVLSDCAVNFVSVIVNVNCGFDHVVSTLLSTFISSQIIPF